MSIPARFSTHHAELTAWRRELHQHPELLYDTVRTAAFVAARLRAFGCDEVATGIGRTGVVGLIRGQHPGSHRVVALRADMDALPITEATGLPHASQTPGLMHACGHDGHTTMLLGAAQLLAAERDFAGTVAVIFQPAEEGGAGARAMCEDGLMARFGIQEVYGMHNMPTLPVGSFAIRTGAFFAATDQFIIDVNGRGGHAATPHQTIDPTIVAAHLTLALQSIVARNTDPFAPLVVSVCTFRTGSEAFNVIPATVQLKGTVRTMDATLRATAEQRIREIATHTAAAFGATAAITYIKGYPAMVNHPQETAFAATVAAELAGPDQVDTAAPAIMGGEDFAFMLEERPGAYILIGNGASAGLHHPAYDFNDDAIPHGVAYWVNLTRARLAG